MTEQTVTINTADHGPVTLPEPAWCTGAHEDDGARTDIGHHGPDIPVTVGTRRGPRELLTMGLTQWPYDLADNDVHAAVQLLDGDHYRYDVPGLEALAEDLVRAAGRLRLMARRLSAELRGGDR